MAIARVAEPSGSLQEVKEWGLDREDLLQIYRNMLITRGVEERGHILYRQGKIPARSTPGDILSTPSPSLPSFLPWHRARPSRAPQE